MEPERWRQVDRIFGSALELPPEQRRQLLDRECAGDDALRREVESLLGHDRGDDFLEAGATAEAARVVLECARESLVGQRVGRFEVEARLGAGGMGEVYRARDPRLGRPVALKLIPAHLRDDPELVRRFRREALATSALNHPNIVTVFEILELEERDVLVTELVDGVTLHERIAAGPLPLDAALDIAIQAARGLAAAHAVGVVHRDVKPRNVMVRRDGLVKVLDFGIAKLFEPAHADHRPKLGETETTPGEVVGTVAYMSPEQARGLAVDARADLWSLGVILYELVTGQAPFRGATPTDTLAEIVLRDPEPPSRRREGLPPELDGILARALAKDRAQRYPDCAAFAAELERLRDEIIETSASGRRRISRRLRVSLARRPGALAGGIVAAAVVAALSALLYTRAGATASIDSLAVMPLVNTSGDPQTEYLSDGITESLIQSLAQAEDIRVASRASVFRYQGLPIDARATGRALGVRGVLTGRLTPRDDGLALSLELIDARDDSHVWGGQYEVGMDELASLHATIARDVHRKLGRLPSGEGQERIARLHSDDAEAYQLYLQGRYYWYRTLPAAYHRSRDLFLRAIEIDPEYALAWAGLAHYYGFGAAAGLLPPDDYWPRTEQAAKRVRELDPRLPEAGPLFPGLTLYWRRDWAAGLQELRRATEAFPEALNHHAFVLGLIGRLDESLRLRKLDIERDPRSGRSHRSLGHTLYLARRHEEAATHLRRALEIDDADLQAWQLLGDVLLELRRESEAVAAWRQAMVLSGSGELGELLGRTYQDSGLEEAVAAVARERAAALQATRERGQYVPAYEIARQYLRAGDRERALLWAERAFEERNRLALDMLSDPVFDPLRDEPRFRHAVDGLGLPREWTDAIARMLGD